MLSMLKKRKKEDEDYFAETDDVLVIFDDENKTSVIERVSEIREGAIYVTGKHAVPVEDVEVTNGVEGRIFFYRAPAQSIAETKRLAALEQSMVLSQITAYKPPQPPNSMDWTKAMLFGLVALGFITIGFSSCGMG